MVSMGLAILCVPMDSMMLKTGEWHNRRNYQLDLRRPATWIDWALGIEDVLLALKAEMNSNRRVNQLGEVELF